MEFEYFWYTDYAPSVSKYLTYLVLVTFLIFLYFFQNFYKTRLSKTAKTLNQFPGPKIIPFLGNFFEAFGPLYLIEDKLSLYIKRYGKVCRFWKFDQPKILIADAGACERILSSNASLEKTAEYEVLKHFVGDGLVTASGAKWRRDRKLLNPAFNRSLMSGFVRVLNKHCKIMQRKLENNFKQKSEAQNIFSILNLAATDMIFETALGFQLNIQNDDRNSECAKHFEWATKAIHISFTKPWLMIPIVWNFMGYGKAEKAFMNYFQDLIKRAIVKNQSTLKAKLDGDNEYLNNKSKPFIETLLTSDVDFTDQEIMNLLLNIVFAGSETTAFSVQMTLFYLALYPQYQVKVRKELTAIFGEIINDNNITLANLSQVKYLEMCWKESMRLTPPVPIFARKIAKDVLLANGQIIPAGIDAFFVLHDLHRDSTVYPNPEAFNPENFQAEAVSNRSPYSYLPFSIGIRNCIGHKFAVLEAKIALIYILKKFEVTTPQVKNDIKYIIGVPSEPHPGIKLCLKLRSDCM